MNALSESCKKLWKFITKSFRSSGKQKLKNKNLYKNKKLTKSKSFPWFFTPCEYDNTKGLPRNFH